MTASTEQPPSLFSKKRKSATFHVNFDWHHAKMGWKTVTGFTKNSLLILAFLVCLSAVLPTYIPGISNERLESRVTATEGRIDAASKDMESIRNDVVWMKSTVADMKATQDKVIWGALAFLLKIVLESLTGLKLKRGE